MPIELSIFESMIRDRFMQLMQVYLNSVLGNENFAVQKYEEFSKSLEMIGAEKNNTVVKLKTFNAWKSRLENQLTPSITMNLSGWLIINSNGLQTWMIWF